MIQSARGIILRTRLLTESSLIVNWLTPNLGRVSTVAKGARRAKSPFIGKLDIFYEADFSFIRCRRSELHTLREVSVRKTRTELRYDLAYLQQASYAVALTEQTTEADTPLEEIFELVCDFWDHLAKQPPQPRSLYAFELKLLNLLGLKPELAKSRLTGGAQEIIRALLESDWRTIAGLKSTAAQAKELRQFLHGFLIYHLGKLPKGRPAP